MTERSRGGLILGRFSRSSFFLGRFFGIKFHLDYSWFPIAALVT